MLNVIWLLLLVIGIAVAAWQGDVSVVTTAALRSADDAVNTCFHMVGVMCLWLGMVRIAEKAGIVDFISWLVRPLTVRLFPSLPPNHPATAAIVMNLSANVLGLGSAATPFGMKAMQEMQKLNGNSKEASEAMCTFLALNTSCITLIPATIIGVRVGLNSANPTEIVGTTIFATCCSMVLAVIADRMFRAVYRRPGGSR
ncbi:MAG: nucleoside recognition domain-containing protein [Solirubrobacterales bacterium]